MERYEVIKEVGNGTFGSVWRALNKQSGEVVAIKKMKKKYYSWEECVNLREVKSLRKMNHPNIVKLKEVIRESDVLYFVFEYMECNLYQIMKDRGRVFSEAEVKNWCFQVFQGLAYIHQHGYFHRDLKPENLLLSRDVLKIADFGLAREINAQPPFTDYVSTRWYRAPEVLLQSPAYGHPVDIWAMGAIMAELFTLRPLFPGSRILGLLVYKAYSYTTLSELKSMQRLKFTLHEADEIYKICCVIGSPSKSEWTQGLELASAINYQFPRVAGVHLSSLVPGVSEDAINLIKSLCSWNPCKRPTALEALQHPFFKSCFYVPPSLRSKPAIARTPAGTRGVLEQNCGMRNTGSLSNPKLAHSSSEKQQEYMVAGVQRKLEMNNQDSTKNDRNLKNYAKPQPRYRPPGINGPYGNMAKTHGVAEAAEKFANMTVGSGRPPSKLSGPPPMKAGGWHRPSDLFLERSQEAIPGRAAAYHRKVAG